VRPRNHVMIGLMHDLYCHSEPVEECCYCFERKVYFVNYYVYILLCSDGSYYTGVSNDVERRLVEHQIGEDKKSYTWSRRPVKLVYSESYPEAIYAITREKQIKGWSRKKKQALIDSRFDDLPGLAKNHASTSSA